MDLLNVPLKLIVVNLVFKAIGDCVEHSGPGEGEELPEGNLKRQISLSGDYPLMKTL